MFRPDAAMLLKLGILGEPPQQKIKLEADVDAYVIEWPSEKNTFHLSLAGLSSLKFFWPNGNLLFAGDGNPIDGVGQGEVYYEDGSLYYRGEFVRFCEANFIQQSMSRAGCPYDNAPMERYFNTLKHELIRLFEFKTEQELDTAVTDFAYGWYNRIRPHTYNGGLTPAAARVA